MRKWIVLVAFVALAGCGISPELRRQAELNERRTAAFIARMDKGETTQLEERDFIRASLVTFQAFKDSLEGHNR